MIIRNKENRFQLLFVWHGTVLPLVLPNIAGIMLLSLIAWGLNHYHVYSVSQIPAVGFTIFGVIISIFLGFRNNACYDRWWEGRKLWGALVANTRHFSRDTHFLSPDLREKLLYKMILFVGLLRNRLRGQNNDFSQFNYMNLDENFINELNKHINPPQYVLEQMQLDLIHAVKNQEISDIIYTSIQRHIIEMGNVQAGCDRIFSTPLPYPYSVLLHRAVFCFCWALPFGLTQITGVWTVFLVGFISYLLLGLDELSYQLEEPFGNADHDLPLDTMTRMMERETLALLGKPIPPTWAVENHFWYR